VSCCKTHKIDGGGKENMENEKKSPDKTLEEKTFGRRNLLKGAGLAGLGFAGAGLLAGRLGMIEKLSGAIPGFRIPSVHAQSIDDADILNFALNLEYLEAEFYTVATTGKTIEKLGIGVNGTGNSGPTTGGAHVALEIGSAFPRRLHAVALEIAYNEQRHVQLLRSALGSYAVAKPAINLDALGIGFANFRQFLKLSRAFEDTGVSAYAGAAPLISSKAYLGVAAQILATEAYHAGNIRVMISENDVETTKTDSEDVLPPPSGTHYFTTDANGLALVRDPGQVLAIVYANSTTGTTAGGFFPDGVNGLINTVTS
jgi:hypothetical protein